LPDATASNFDTTIMFTAPDIQTIFHRSILDLTFSRKCLYCSPPVMTLCSLAGGQKFSG
jgi:hypothetical protein